MSAPTVGIFPPFDLVASDPGRTRDFLDQTDHAGVDHVCCGDHVSFFVGAGFDGLLTASVLTALHATLPVYTGVYLLPLRHPVLVARQLADLAQLGPGRLIFGVGIGGEDPHEVEICGVDPRTRGRRMDECLAIVRALMTGGPCSFHGEFFDVDDALILPAPREPIPIVVGGRSDAAVRRAGRLADGWLGVWNSPRRFADVVTKVDAAAAEAGRAEHPRRHAMQVWCGIADDRATARSALAPAMERFYQSPFEPFEKYSPYGTPADLADFLTPYVDEGCTAFNLIPQAAEARVALEGVAEVKRLLARR